MNTRCCLKSVNTTLKAVLFCLLLASVLATAREPRNSSAETLIIIAKALNDSVRVPESLGVPGPQQNLQQIVAQAPDSSVILIEGLHRLKPQAYVDESCGNCEIPATRVDASVGLIVSGKAKRIVGISPYKSAIHTNSGYGILFENCQDCSIESLTITDGARDPDGNATDAAVVVKNSSVLVAYNLIINNVGDSTIVKRTIVGIMGITGREGSDITIRRNEIFRNSWDGIALYRDAHAVIEQNFIDGIDLARGERIGGGRGVGIGLTWNAKALVRGNLVRRYWKGIGIFVDAEALVFENVIENIATWGISLWDADKGTPCGRIMRNVIFRTGSCGAAIESGACAVSDTSFFQDTGSFVENILVSTGQNPKYDSGEPYCFQRALAVHKKPATFLIAENLFFANRESGDKTGSQDVSKSEFLARIDEIEPILGRTPLKLCSEFFDWLDSIKKN